MDKGLIDKAQMTNDSAAKKKAGPGNPEPATLMLIDCLC